MKIKKIWIAVTVIAVGLLLVSFVKLPQAKAVPPGKVPPGNSIIVPGPIEMPPPVQLCPSDREPTRGSLLQIGSLMGEMISDSILATAICGFDAGSAPPMSRYQYIRFRYLENLQEIRGDFQFSSMGPFAPKVTFMWQITDYNGFLSPVHAVALSPEYPGSTSYHFRISSEELAAIYQQIPWNSSGMRNIRIVGEVCSMNDNDELGDQKWALYILSPVYGDGFGFNQPNSIGICETPSQGDNWPGFDSNPVR